jgi:cytochrome c-type biogenesis protein CcmE
LIRHESQFMQLMSVSAKRKMKHDKRVRVGGAAQHGALRRMLMSRAAVLGA